ncbi:MAG: DUF998 domain-containing protein [Candidatus Thorarchaeota archaeon]|nr:DUF998 domain-containing protein [Candidatus Thorarchaeota archaeon]
MVVTHEFFSTLANYPLMQFLKTYLRDPFFLAITGTIIALSCIFLAIGLSPWFDWFANALSDLGNYDNGLGAAIVFNSGLIIGGLMATWASILLLRIIKDVYTRVGIGIYTISAIFLITIGIFSENVGRLHYYVSVGFFLTFPFAMWAIGLSWLRFRGLIWFAIISLLLPFVSFYLWSITFGGTAPWTRVAIPEILTASTMIGWLWALVFLLRQGVLSHLTSES